MQKKMKINKTKVVGGVKVRKAGLKSSRNTQEFF